MWFARFGDKIEKDQLIQIALVVESYFAFSMYANFMTEFLPEGHSHPCRNLTEIA